MNWKELRNRGIALIASAALAAAPLVAQPAHAQSHGQSKISPALLAEMTAYPLERIPIIIEMTPATVPFTSPVNVNLAQQAVGILNANGQSVGGLPVIQGAAGYATSAQITAMSLLPQVAAISQDAVVRPRKPPTGGTPYPPGELASNYPRETNATRVWATGGTGRGVTVAVLDSGVAADPDLGNRVLASVGFAGPRDRPDRGGHGSHIAGTIAGDGTKSNQQFVGMAPNANIVDVQVLDQYGNGRYSSILAGLGWVLSNKAAYNIRVVNLSFGAPTSTPTYRADPLAAGVEVAWRNGLVVVAAAGNRGPSADTVESPGIDPYVITVGSTDDANSLPLNDDTLGWWSSWGTPSGSAARPDLVAVGRRIISLWVQGSTLDTRLPDHVVTATNGSKYMRLTGTSMSTAVVSGAVALMLERNPTLTPDQVKNVLTATVQPFGVGAIPSGAGAGALNAYAAVTSAARVPANLGQRQADGLARTLYPAMYGRASLVWRDVNYLGTNWLAYTWATLPWTSTAWDNIAWDNIAWDNIAWDNIAWDNIAWDNIAWDNIAWDNTEWNNIAWDSFSFD